MKRTVPVLIILLMQVFYISCGSRGLQRQYNKLNEQTVFVGNTVVIKAVRCQERGIENTPACIELLKKLPNIYESNSGSGTFIKHKGKIKVLTAEHVCRPDSAPQKIEKDDFVVEVLKESSIKIASQNFVSNGKVVKFNEEKDLCLVELEEQPDVDVAWVALYMPLRGSRIHYAGAPYSMMSEEFLLYFEGTYSGPMQEIEVFALPCAPGASGSSIRDDQNMIVSMVQKVHNKFHHICFGVNTSAIREFLSN